MTTYKLPDTILYTVVTEPGGQDGRDPNDKGGTVVLATFFKNEAEKHKGLDSRLRIEKQVVNDDDVQAAIKKLTVVERVLLGVQAIRTLDAERSAAAR